jgi:hypothetical protein
MATNCALSKVEGFIVAALVKPNLSHSRQGPSFKNNVTELARKLQCMRCVFCCFITTVELVQVSRQLDQSSDLEVRVAHFASNPKEALMTGDSLAKPS